MIGDAVNIASRLESTNKVYGSEIIIGPQTRSLAGDGILVRELDRLAVFGRAGGLQIYELLGMAGDDATPVNWIASYEAGLADYRRGDFAAAKGHFQSAIALRGSDPASSIMIARCDQLSSGTHDPEWTGTAKASSK